MTPGLRFRSISFESDVVPGVVPEGHSKGFLRGILSEVVDCRQWMKTEKTVK